MACINDISQRPELRIGSINIDETNNSNIDNNTTNTENRMEPKLAEDLSAARLSPVLRSSLLRSITRERYNTGRGKNGCFYE